MAYARLRAMLHFASYAFMQRAQRGIVSSRQPSSALYKITIDECNGNRGEKMPQGWIGSILRV